MLSKLLSIFLTNKFYFILQNMKLVQFCTDFFFFIEHINLGKNDVLLWGASHKLNFVEFRASYPPPKTGTAWILEK